MTQEPDAPNTPPDTPVDPETPENPDPIEASFTATPTSGHTPLEVQFTDTSSSSGITPTKWYWQFGDGNTSILQHPLHTYTNGGLFTVTLTVECNDGGIYTHTETDLIDVDANPIITGTVYDVINDNLPIEGAEITIGDLSTTTNEHGRYTIIVPITQPDPAQVVTCKKPSYIKCQKVEAFRLNEIYTIDFRMWYTPAIINAPRRRPNNRP